MKKISIRKSDHSLLFRESGGWVFLLFASLFVACQSQPTVDAEEQARRDSAALHVALMPVDDCVPIYYAERTGIYDSLGLDLRIRTLQAQLDTDTALMRHRAELIYSDLARAIMMQQDTTPLRAVAAPRGALSFVTVRRGRVRQLHQLRERMVAVARHSITDYWSDRLTDSAQMERADIFRPQINNVRIRTDMICNGTMDAAFLPSPFDFEALVRAANFHFSTATSAPRLACFLIPERVMADTTRMQQLQLLLQGYTLATQQLNKGIAIDTLAAIYRELCLIPDSLLDTLVSQRPPFEPLMAPQPSDARAALEWLKSRKKVREGYTTDSLIYNMVKP